MQIARLACNSHSKKKIWCSSNKKTAIGCATVLSKSYPNHGHTKFKCNLARSFTQFWCLLSSVPTRTDLSIQVRIFGLLYGFFFKRDHFYRFYSLILLFCKLYECDAICCELYDNKYQKNLVSILSILLLQSIDTINSMTVSILFSCFLT